MIQMDKIEPIDLVYLWCDVSDPIWAAQKSEAMKKAGVPVVATSDATGDKRYKQLDELKYSLRSAYENVPWLNHIYIVTDNRMPAWFKEHPKISIVRSDDFIPSELLPAFSSVTIEMYLDQIPGLSEKFLYANDDFFFNIPLKKEDFYRGDNPIIWFEKWCPFGRDADLESIKKHVTAAGEYSWIKTVARAYVLFCERNALNDKTFPFYGTIHSIEAFTKTIFKKVIRKYPEIRAINRQTFRTGKEIQRIIFPYEFSYAEYCETHINPRRTKLNRFKSRFTDIGMFAILTEQIAGFREELKVFKPKTFCLNNIQQDQQQALQEFLEEKFPRPAPWEVEIA